MKEDPPPARTPRESGPNFDAKTSRADAQVFSRFSPRGNCGIIMTSFSEVRTPTRHRLSQGRMEYLKPEPCLNSWGDFRSSLPHNPRRIRNQHQIGSFW